MAEKVELFELDIDAGDVIKETAEIRKGVVKLREEIKALKEEEGDHSLEIEKLNAQLKAEQGELRANENLTKKLAAANKENAGTITKLEAANEKLRIERKGLNTETEEGIERLEEINAAIDKNTEAIKDQSDTTKRGKLEVGQYAKGIKEASEELDKQNPIVKKLGTSLKGFGKGLGTGLKAIGVGLKAAGIGLVIAAFTTLFEAFKKNQKVIDGFNTVVNAIGIALRPVVDVITDVVTKVNDSSNGFEGLRGVIGGLLKVGLTPLKLAFFGIKLGVQEVELGWLKLKKAFGGGVDQSAIDELNIKIQDTKTSIGEVKDNAAAGFQSIADNAVKAFNEVSSVVEQSTAGITEAFKEVTVQSILNQAKAATQAAKSLAQLDAQQEKIKLQGLEAAELQRQLRDDENAAIEDRIAANEELERILNKQQEDESVIVEQKIAAQKKIAAAEQENIEAQNRLAELENQRLELSERITGQFAEQKTNAVALYREQAELSVAALEAETTAYLAAEEIKTKALEEQALIRFEKEKEILNLRLENDLIKQQEYDAELAVYTAERDAEIDQLQLDRQILNADNERAILETSLLGKLDAEKAALKQQQKLEILYANKIGADVTKINEKYANAEIALEHAKTYAKLSLASTFAGNIASILGENTKLGKAAAVAQTTIDTYKGATAAFASFAGTGPVGVALGVAAAGAAVVAGLANVKKILSVKTDPKSGSASSAGGGGVSYSSVSVPTSVSTPSVVQSARTSPAGVAGEIGRGIASRELGGVDTDVSVQPTLVVDDVTANQDQNVYNNKTATLG